MSAPEQRVVLSVNFYPRDDDDLGKLYLQLRREASQLGLRFDIVMSSRRMVCESCYDEMTTSDDR